MKTRGFLAAAVLAVLFVTACTTQPSAPGGSAQPSPKASVGIEGYSAGEWARLWALYGVSPAPLDDPMTAHRQGIPRVLNLTGGGISDADARRWVAGLMRSNSTVRWADEHLADGVLLGGGLGSERYAASNVFDVSIPRIRSARDVGARALMGTSRPATAVGVTIVPNDLVAAYADRAPLTHFALVAWYAGPFDPVLVFPDGHREHFGPEDDAPAEFVASGEYLPRGAKHQAGQDQPFGPIWFIESSWSCRRHPDLAPVCSQVPAPG